MTRNHAAYRCAIAVPYPGPLILLQPRPKQEVLLPWSRPYIGFSMGILILITRRPLPWPVGDFADDFPQLGPS